jgi:SAM-dependent methyltransferase
MAGFDDPAFYGERWADVYDERYGYLDPVPAVDFLARLVGAGTDAGADAGTGAGGAGSGSGGRVLELAIGTGRVALPLAARGITVEGVDASEAMVARLRAKPGGASVPVTIGDMADGPASGPFRLVYLVFNSLFGLLSQARQADCFRNAARVLEPGGAFVIECFVPDVARFDHGQRAQARVVTEDSALAELSCHDAAAQRITTQVAILDGQGIHLRPVVLRYCWPAELDLMADQAGLRLRERYGDWDRRPFGPASDKHVSVYRRDWPDAP